VTVDILNLGYKVDTAPIKRAEQDLEKFGKANTRAAGEVNELGKRSDSTSKQLAGFKTQLAGLVAVYASFASARALIDIADQYTKFTAQLKLATDSQEQFTQAYSNVVDIARSSQSEIGGLGTLYARITNATREMGLAQSDVAKISETVALSLRVSGASASESASAMLQLSQAFGSGVLRGEEFNAVNEAAPGLLRALAESIGAPVGALREMASNGELTADVLARAFKDDELLAKLREQVKEVQTISSAVVALKNEFTIYVGEIDKSLGVSNSLSAVILELSKNFDLLARAAVGFAAVYGSRKILELSAEFATFAAQIINQSRALEASKDAAIAESTAKIASVKATQSVIIAAQAENAVKLASANSSLGAARAQLKAASAIGAYGVALLAVRQAEAAAIASTKARSAALAELAILGQQAARVNAQLTASTAALTAAQNIGVSTATIGSRALGLLGGPIGAITTALSLGAAAWALWGGKAEENENKAQNAVSQSTPVILTDIEKQVQAIERRNELIRLGVPTIASESQADKLAEIVKQIDEVQRLGTLQGKAIVTIEGRQSVLAGLGKKFGEITKQINEEAAKLAENEKKLQSVKFEEYMAKYATSGEKAAAAIAKAKKELGDLFTPELEKRILESFSKTRKESVKNTEESTKALKELQKVREEALEQQLNVLNAEANVTDQIKEQTIQIIEQTRAVGMSESQLRQLELAKIDDQIATTEQRISMISFSDANDDLIKQYKEQIASLNNLKSAKTGLYNKQAAQKIVDANKEVAKQIEDDLVDAFENAFLRGGDFASSLKRAIEAQFAKLVLRPVIQSVVGSAGSALSSVGGLSGLLSGAGNISSLFGAVSGGLVSGIGNSIASAGSLFGSSALGSFAAGVKGSTLAAGLAGPTTAGASGALGLGATFGAALPWLGGGLALAGLLGSTRLFGRGKVSASILDQNFLGEQQASLQNRFLGTVGALGGTAANASFFFGGNTGRQGQNPNFHLGLDLNGRRRFTTLESRAGATGENGTFLDSEIALNQENISLFTTRAVVTALQESNFARNINELFDSIDERTASMEELTQLFSDAESLKNFNDAMREMNGPLRSLSNSSLDATLSFLRAVNGLEGFQQRMSFFYKEFTSDAEQFSDMSSMLSSELRAVGGALFSTREQFSDFFKTLGPDQFARISALLPQIDSYYDTIEQRQAESFKATLDSLERIRKAGLGIADYLRQLGIAEETLSPQKRLQAASAEFNRLLSLSKLGDVASLEKITGASDQLLNAARSFFGSNAEFKTIFDRVTTELSSLTQGQTGNVFTAQPIAFQRQDQTNQQLITEVQGLRSDIASGESINIKVVTVDGKVIMEETLSAARERSRRGELVVYAAGVK
jgi:tape measure domain-containing protein